MEFARAAAGRDDQYLIACAAQTLDRLGQYGDDAIYLGQKRLRHDGNSHSLLFLFATV
jgi:hypothetical protein